MIIKWNEKVIRKELVNPYLIHFKDWIDKYAEACEDMPRTHNKHSFYGRTQQRGKTQEQRSKPERNVRFVHKANILQIVKNP